MYSRTFGRLAVPAFILSTGLTACAGLVPSGGGLSSQNVLPGTQPAAPAEQGSASKTTRPDGRRRAVTIFTANRDGESVIGFKIKSSGNAAPAVSIAGANTMLYEPDALAMDSKANIYTANDGDSQVEIFAPNANGNVAPKHVLGGGKTKLGYIEGLYADPSDRLWASDYYNNVLTAYAPGAKGNAAPVNTIGGTNTQLDGPVGMAMDENGRIYAANAYSASIIGFAPGAGGNATPVVAIAGGNTGLVKPFAIAFNSRGELIVADEGAGVLVFAKGATGNVAPIQTITGLSYADGVMADAHDNIWVAEFLGNAIKEFAPNANGPATPLRSISGPQTTLDGANYLVMN